jgi:DNA-binding transcriptional LysR family regulator
VTRSSLFLDEHFCPFIRPSQPQIGLNTINSCFFTRMVHVTDIHAGRLVPVLPEWWSSFPGPFLYYSSRRLVPPPLRAFLGFIESLKPLELEKPGKRSSRTTRNHMTMAISRRIMT